MDWVTLLLIFFFVVLPILQQVVEQARRGGQTPDEGDPSEFGPFDAEEPVVTAESAERAGTEGGGWSEGWVPWPEPAAPVEPAPAPEPGPAPERPARQEISFEHRKEQTLGRWEGASRGRPRVPDIPKPAAPLERPPARLPTRPRPAPALVSPTAVTQVDVMDLRHHPLTDPAELRRAMVLAEIVGPPVSLRPPRDP